MLSAMQGNIGLDLAHQHLPNMILLDLHLPDIQGEEVLARLRSDPVTRDIPVVIITADATPGQVQRLIASGAAAYLTKPLNVSQFLDLLDELLVDAEF
jgi:CheY-like chemotaxis protein